MNNRLPKILGAIFSGMPFSVYSQNRDSYAYHGHEHMWGAGGHFFGPVFMLLILAVIIAIVFFLAKSWHRPEQNISTKNIHQSNTPLEILKTRYAQGEIDQEEFEMRRKTLESI